MGGQKRRTEIQIETHEITIIRIGGTHNIDPLDKVLGGVSVAAHADLEDPSVTEDKEKRNEE